MFQTYRLIALLLLVGIAGCQEASSVARPVPAYPGARHLVVSRGPKPKTIQPVLSATRTTFDTLDGPATVQAWYERTLPLDGWWQNRLVVDNATEISFINHGCPRMYLRITWAAPAEGMTQVTVDSTETECR